MTNGVCVIAVTAISSDDWFVYVIRRIHVFFHYIPESGHGDVYDRFSFGSLVFTNVFSSAFALEFISFEIIIFFLNIVLFVIITNLDRPFYPAK